MAKERSLEVVIFQICGLGRVIITAMSAYLAVLGAVTSEKADSCYSNGCPDGHNFSSSSLYMRTQVHVIICAYKLFAYPIKAHLSVSIQQIRYASFSTSLCKKKKKMRIFGVSTQVL